MVFAKEAVEGIHGSEESMICLLLLNIHTWDRFCFYNGAWDGHIKKVLDCGRKKVNQLHSVISNRDINLSAIDYCVVI